MPIVNKVVIMAITLDSVVTIKLDKSECTAYFFYTVLHFNK